MRIFLLPITLLTTLFLLLGLPRTASGEEILHEAAGWSLNTPETWRLVDQDEGLTYLSFADQQSHAFFQIFTTPKTGKDDAATKIGDQFMKGLKAQLSDGGSSLFYYNSVPAKLADIAWNNNGTLMRGYLLTLDGFALLAYAWKDDWAGYHDFLLSNLDSFAGGDEARLQPGPISQLLGSDPKTGQPSSDPKVVSETAQLIVERESRVLFLYSQADQNTQTRAWRRFYQALYRDNYSRLLPVSVTLSKVFQDSKVAKKDIPSTLLSWIQAFTYEESKGFDHVRAPVDAVSQKLGDCDSRCLSYMILLDQMGFRSLLMISPVYQHSLVGVDAQGDGARFSWDNTKWLVAETTAKVAIGQIAQSQSDPKNWMGFDLEFKP